MKYISTRGQAPALDFEEVLLAGLATDGGLYLPEKYPTFSPAELRAMQGLSYPDLATKVMLPFVQGSLTESEVSEMAHQAYKKFNHKAVAPLKQLSDNVWLMELFHGPTLAFKDYALQLVGLMFDKILNKRKKHITIVGATSGDTGSAAIEACKNKEGLDIFILHPHKRVSEVQRRQMTTVLSDNVFNIALEGTFDDCQAIVKALFADTEFRENLGLSAVNSINWARIMVQIVYYFRAALQLGAPDRLVSFAVPTGNFGNVFAGYVAKQMGLPIKQLMLGSNVNDILPRFLDDGVMKKQEVLPSISPSMDIQISSNFERLLFEAYDRNSQSVIDLMNAFKLDGIYKIPPQILEKIKQDFCGLRCDDAQTKAQIKKVYEQTSEILDPHSAIGAKVAETFETSNFPIVVLATAHPAKFPIPVREAIGITPVLPTQLADLLAKKETFTVLPNSFQSIKYFIETQVRQKGSLS